MQSVSRFWYRVYYGWMLLFSSAMLLTGVATMFVPGFQGLGEHFSVNVTTLFLSLAYLTYAATIHWVVRRHNETMALFAGNWLFTTILMNGLSHADSAGAFLLYAIPWLIGVALMGMFGLPFLLMSCGFTGTYIMMEYQFRLSDISPAFMYLFAGTAAVALVAFHLWKRAYIDVQAQRIHQLSGIIANKEIQSDILINAITDGVIGIDTTGTINLINPAAAVLTGWQQKDAVGIDIRAVMVLSQENDAPLDESLNPFATALSSGQPSTQTFTLTNNTTQDKSIISLSVSPIITEAHKLVGVVAVFRDISKEHEEEQRRAEFISTASHEMRTPVAAIEGYLALALNDKVSKIDTRAREYLEKAHASTKHLGQLFQDLLTSAKAEDGRLTSHPEVVEMGSLLEHLVDDLRFSAQKKGLYTEFVIGSGGQGAQPVSATNTSADGPKTVRPLYYVYADPDRLREAATNLFDNAVKYTQNGKVTIGLTGDSSVVQFYVRDTGAGIPKDDIPHLFQKFYRVDSSATRTVGGTGLGLFICRKIIELYNGRIWVESQVDRGSTFYINLPRLDTQKALAMQSSTSPEYARVAAAAATPQP